jgi:hypothetical protein
VRWPDGFHCPACGHRAAWSLKGKAHTLEIAGNRPGRARLQTIADYSADSLSGFVPGAVAPGATVISDGWSGYAKLKEVKHDARVVVPLI